MASRNAILLASAAAAAILSAAATKAEAVNTLSATYYSVAPGDSDFQSDCCNTYYNQVTGKLGPDGLPVLNPTYGGPTIHDVNGSGEIEWWSPSLDPHVSRSGTGTIALPYTNTSFFPPMGNGTNDAHGFQTAVFSGTLNLPEAEKVTFSAGADDAVFAYVDGNTVINLGGVHPDTPASSTTSVLSAGSHSLEVFYADLYQTQAALNFAITTEDVTTMPVPEPASLGFVGLGVLSLAWARRRRAV